MDAAYGAVARFDCCLESERELLESKVQQLYDRSVAPGPEAFGLHTGPHFERELARCEYYYDGDPARVTGEMQSIRAADSAAMDDYSGSFTGLSGSADLSAFDTVGSLLLQRESRNFVDVVTVGTVDAKTLAGVLDGDPQASLDELRRALYGVERFLPDISWYERFSRLQARYSVAYVGTTDRADYWSTVEAADAGPDAALESLRADPLLSRLLLTDDTPVTLLASGDLLTHREDGDLWGPLTAVGASEPVDDAPDTDLPASLAPLSPLLRTLLPYLSACYWERARFGDVVDIEKDVERNTRDSLPTISGDGRSERTVREVTDDIEAINSHRTVCVDIADELTEVRQSFPARDAGDAAGGPGSDDGSATATTGADHDGRTDERLLAGGGAVAEAGGYLDAYDRDLRDRLDRFERQFDSITDKLDGRQRIYTDQLAGQASYLDLRESRENVAVQESIKRLTLVLIALTVLLILEAVWGPLAGAAGGFGNWVRAVVGPHVSVLAAGLVPV